MGYSDEQRADLTETINAVDADLVLIATPIDLRKVCEIQKPAVRVFYDLEEMVAPTLEEILRERLNL
jgi:predicted GTPase